MYLPHNVPLCRPHVAMWIGASGKRYDFAVCRPGTLRVDEPAIYILARHEGDVTTPLFVGYTGSLHRHFGLSSERCPEEWRRALAMRMTHVHVRFDVSSNMTRQAEAEDLVAALSPALNDQSVRDEERSVLALETAERAAIATGQARPYRREWFGDDTKARSPALGEVDAGWHSSGSRGLAPPPLFRADPAREDDGDSEDFEAPEASPDMPPHVQHRLDMPPAAAASAEAVEVVQVTPPVKPGGLAMFLRRFRELVARMRTPRHLHFVEDTGSAALPTLPASALPEPAALPVVAGPAEPDEETGEMLDAVPKELREDAKPVQHEHVADATLVEASKDGSAPGPIMAEAPAPEPIMAEAPAPGPITAEAPAPEPIVAEGDSLSRQEVSQEEAKRGLDLDPSAPVALFAGNLCYEAGADILLDAIVTVCGGNDRAQFLFAGDGAMRGELQALAAQAGLERRCRFLGHVPASDFDRVLRACDFVVIPSRVRQGEDLARMAVANGKPVLMTHQAGVGVIVHGQNGLLTYDNPGSFVWGIRELLGPTYANLRRHLAEAK
jgi:glycosyltransferase involved in cell wall biosynthesis